MIDNCSFGRYNKEKAEWGEKMVYCLTYDSPMGVLLLTSDGNSLTGLDFTDSPVENSPDIILPPVFDSARKWLDAYFKEEPIAADFSMDPPGTPFQKLVWELLLEIPYGETMTYGGLAKETAKRMGKSKMSAQAIGQAVRRNPVCIIIPCHRIIGAGGKLTGYASGIHRKQWLLNHERKSSEGTHEIRRV